MAVDFELSEAKAFRLSATWLQRVNDIQRTADRTAPGRGPHVQNYLDSSLTRRLVREVRRPAHAGNGQARVNLAGRDSRPVAPTKQGAELT